MILLSMWLACGGARPPVVAIPAPPDPAHMQEVLDEANAARHAIIAGDLRGARNRLGWLADHAITTTTPPPEWARFAEQVQAAAAVGADGGNVLQLAHAMADMAIACGGCHAAAGAGPRFAAENLPPGDDTKLHMARHQWAIDSMWEGLVAPDEHRWRSGAFAFLEAPLEEGSDDVLPPGAASWMRRLHALGEQALTTPDAPARARQFGELVAMCSLCHQAAGAGPD